MSNEEKPIKIKIQNGNCLIYLKKNEISLLDKDKNKKHKNDDNLYEDIKEMSYSVSNISENFSSKRKHSFKNIKEKTDFEISNISIFNSNLKQEDSILKTPLYEKINETFINNNKSKRKENNTDFIGSLKSKSISIKKLNFDSAESDTMQETDTIKKLYKQKKKKEENKENINVENINKNLHNQFVSNAIPEIINENNTLDNEISEKDKNIFRDKGKENKISENEIKINNINIANIKNELISTIKYKSECLEEYNIKSKKSKSKQLINNKNKLEINCRSLSRDNKENNPLLINLKDKNIIKKIDKKNKNNRLEIKITKNNSYIRKRGILNKHIKKEFNSIKTLNNNRFNNNKHFLNYNKSSYFNNKINLKTNNIKINVLFSHTNISKYQNYKNIYNLHNNNNFHTNCFSSCLSSKNIFIKKNAPLHNNYLSQGNYNIERNILYNYGK